MYLSCSLCFKSYMLFWFCYLQFGKKMDLSTHRISYCYVVSSFQVCILMIPKHAYEDIPHIHVYTHVDIGIREGYHQDGIKWYESYRSYHITLFHLDECLSIIGTCTHTHKKEGVREGERERDFGKKRTLWKWQTYINK